MQYRVNSLITNNYLINILRNRGILQPQEYLRPQLEYIESPTNLDNIEKGRLLLEKNLQANSKIGLIVDCDCDGYTSASILYNFIKYYYPNINIDYFIHSGKQHGLEDKFNDIINNNYNLILVPDAGSNDFNYQKQLNEVGTDILILDHHLVDDIDNDWYNNNEHTVIINNQLSKNYTNKALSGAGVTWQFCRYYEEHLTPPLINSSKVYTLMDLAATGIIGDCMDMRTLENRAFSYFGLHVIYNDFLKAIVDKQKFFLKRTTNLSPTNISFYIVPLINAIIRVGSIFEKEKLFETFIDGKRIVPSNKRGEKGLTEELVTQMTRTGANAKARQDTAVERAMNEIDMQLQANDEIENNKIIIAEIDDEMDFPATLNGLIAMKLAAKYRKPVLIVRKNSEGFLRGSARNEGKSELKDLRTFLLESNYFEYTMGHENAFGVSINEKEKDKFLKYANEKLAKYNFDDNFYNVDISLNANDDNLKDFILNVYKDDTLWGQKNDSPLIAAIKVKLTKDKIQVCGTRKDTLRFTYNGITYIKFFATKEIEELLSQPNEEIILTIIGEGAINDWNGIISPQIMIKEYEIGGCLFDF